MQIVLNYVNVIIINHSTCTVVESTVAVLSQAAENSTCFSMILVLQSYFINTETDESGTYPLARAHAHPMNHGLPWLRVHQDKDHD